jgi:hypothetical protein
LTHFQISGSVFVASGADIAVPARPILPGGKKDSLFSLLLAPIFTAFFFRILMHIIQAAKL